MNTPNRKTTVQTKWLVMSLGVFVVLCLFALFVQAYIPVIIVQASRNECVKRARALDPFLPLQATNVDVTRRARLLRFHSRLSIGESDFLTWVNRKGITPAAITAPSEVQECLFDFTASGFPVIANGWSGKTSTDERRTIAVAYNRYSATGYVTAYLTR